MRTRAPPSTPSVRLPWCSHLVLIRTLPTFLVRHQVAVLGAAGGIGQSLSLLLKMNPLISDLNLYDLRGTAGVAADLSHTNTGCAVAGFEGPDELAAALEGCDLVIIPARSPQARMTRMTSSPSTRASSRTSARRSPPTAPARS